MNHGSFTEQFRWRSLTNTGIVWFGIVFPLCTIAEEWYSPLYGNFTEIAWPYPLTALALLVPILNAVVFWKWKQGGEPGALFFRLAGLAFGLSGLYTLFFLPLLPVRLMWGNRPESDHSFMQFGQAVVGMLMLFW